MLKFIPKVCGVLIIWAESLTLLESTVSVWMFPSPRLHVRLLGSAMASARKDLSVALKQFIWDGSALLQRHGDEGTAPRKEPREEAFALVWFKGNYRALLFLPSHCRCRWGSQLNGVPPNLDILLSFQAKIALWARRMQALRRVRFLKVQPRNGCACEDPYTLL